ncbi:N-glycosylation protein-domain-containing protein [Infundibulicybe gibba]|nr:N-glycosylation protein-domain-containing protein [Infundibulicybe gibba]
MQPSSDDDDDDDQETVVYTSWRSSSGTSLRANTNDRPICTTPGHVCAGETETEMDEPPRHLPTSRKIIPTTTTTSEGRLGPLLFEFSRLLAIVPAFFGTLYNIHHTLYPPTSAPDGRRPPARIDYLVSTLWALLTGYQCLRLTTGLLTRWRVYYPPLPTLIRLLALQAICWPATHLTLTLLQHEKRPAAVWAAIGTTTSVSRSVQIWVTSNLSWERSPGGEGYWRGWSGGKWGGRRWNWKEVGVKCVLPAGVVYFVMAWAEQLRREWEGC